MDLHKSLVRVKETLPTRRLETCISAEATLRLQRSEAMQVDVFEHFGIAAFDYRCLI
jgi:hypothetical protein